MTKFSTLDPIPSTLSLPWRHQVPTTHQRPAFFRLELGDTLFPMGLKRQLNQPADKLCRLDPAGLPGRKGESPGCVVDLMHEGPHPVGIDEDSDARDPARGDILIDATRMEPFVNE